MPGAPISLEAEYINLEADDLLLDTLRTRLIQSVHDSSVYGHPGRDATSSILARNFYYLLQSRHLRQFLQNCSYYGRNGV